MMIDAQKSAAELPQVTSGPQVRGLRLSSFVAGAVLGFLGAALAIVAVWIVLTRDTTPLLTEADYEAAVRRWQQHAPANYHLDVTVGGNRPGRVHVEVRSGEVTRMSRDGVVPNQTRTWDYWSVPGQLDTIARELEMSKDPGSLGAPAGSQVVLRAAFDPLLGYPRRFRRDVLGVQQDVQWDVVDFGVDP